MHHYDLNAGVIWLVLCCCVLIYIVKRWHSRSIHRCPIIPGYFNNDFPPHCLLAENSWHLPGSPQLVEQQPGMVWSRVRFLAQVFISLQLGLLHLLFVCLYIIRMYLYYLKVYKSDLNFLHLSMFKHSQIFSSFKINDICFRVYKTYKLWNSLWCLHIQFVCGRTKITAIC